MPEDMSDSRARALEQNLRAELVRKDVYAENRAADERLRVSERDALKDVLHEIRDDVSDVRNDIAEIKANDRRRVGVLVASLVIPLITSLIVLWVSVQVIR